jgi:methionyl-tRNA formyltransferase
MKTVVFAYHTMGVIGLRALADHGFSVQAVFSHLDDPNENCWFESVAAWADENRIPIFRPSSPNTPECIRNIAAMSPDAIFSFYYRHLLCGQILDIPTGGAFNLHGSLLPAYRGRCPVNWAIVNGETRTGVTLHHMIERPDAGDIVAQTEIAVDYEDTAYTLYSKIQSASKRLLDTTLPLIKNGRAPRREQDLKSGSYFGKRTPDDGKIDWSRPAPALYNLVRAVTAPYPGAFTFLPDGRKLFIWKAFPEAMEAPANSNQQAGRVIVENRRVFVKTPDGRLELLSVGTAGDIGESKNPLDIFENIAGEILI